MCGSRFVRQMERSSLHAEAILIHEALHSLGLGENPSLERLHHGADPGALRVAVSADGKDNRREPDGTASSAEVSCASYRSLNQRARRPV